MRKPIMRWIGLLAMCLALLGCDGESATTEPTHSTAPAEQAAAQSLAMVLETSEPTYWRDGQEVSTTDDLRVMVLSTQSKIDQGYAVSIDESHQRASQVRVLLEPTSRKDNDVDLRAQADTLFAQLKLMFDERAKQALADEFAHQQALAKAAAQAVAELQQTLQTFQENQRGLPATDASRLERRKLDRQIETTLQAQINADKRIEQLQRRIDRERYVTLLRVK